MAQPNDTVLPRVYRAQHVRQALACDPRVSELGVEIEIGEHHVWVRGRVATLARRDAVLAIVRDACGATSATASRSSRSPPNPTRRT